LNFEQAKKVLPKAFFLIINLFSVYFFEYCIISCFADRMYLKLKDKYPDEKDTLQIKQFYTILNNSYQIGVFLSRSSLQYVQIKKVWILSALQFINFVVMFLNTKFMVIESLFILCPFYFWIGLMGGGSFVNVMKNILDLDTLDSKERDIAFVLSLIFNDLGVLSAAIFTLIIDSTIFQAG